MKLGMTLLISIVAVVAMSAARSDLPPERQLTDAVQRPSPLGFGRAVPLRRARPLTLAAQPAVPWKVRFDRWLAKRASRESR